MLSKCCCCISLRKGIIFISAIGIFGGIGSLILGVLEVGGIKWPNIIVAALCFVGYGCMLFGAIKYHRNVILISVLAIAMLFALQLVFSIYFWLHLNCKRTNGCDELAEYTTLVRLATGFFLSSGIHLYFWLCNYSFYESLKNMDFYPLLTEEDFS